MEAQPVETRNVTSPPLCSCFSPWCKSLKGKSSSTPLKAPTISHTCPHYPDWRAHKTHSYWEKQTDKHGHISHPLWLVVFFKNLQLCMKAHGEQTWHPSTWLRTAPPQPSTPPPHPTHCCLKLNLSRARWCSDLAALRSSHTPKMHFQRRQQSPSSVISTRTQTFSQTTNIQNKNKPSKINSSHQDFLN